MPYRCINGLFGYCTGVPWGVRIMKGFAEFEPGSCDAVAKKCKKYRKFSQTLPKRKENGK